MFPDVGWGGCLGALCGDDARHGEMVCSSPVIFTFIRLTTPLFRRYEWREPSATVNPGLKSHVHLPVENGQVKLPSYVAPVVQSCNKIQSQYLKSVDPQLWRSMQAAGIEPQIFGMWV
jgi:TBC1 domain family protein 5